MAQRYVANPLHPTRRRTREVAIGDVRVGGQQPIRVQSMTNTDTLDTRGTADQVERLVQAGCEIVRITAPSLNEAENLKSIRQELERRGLRVPLVADIHFTPNAALVAAEYVEKVRINPGNYADKKKFAVHEYGDREYAEELERVAERFRPLVRRCKQLGRALRIGTNHGSLSDRVMNRFGDTPLGMVESALEFLDVCEAEGFRDVVFSMKSSNTQVAIAAYRLLAARLAERALRRDGDLEWAVDDYPLHVGVTEAGNAEDGRIKSAIGIGALLLDGLGDTIRVSLTEDPVCEVPVAREIAREAEALWRRAARMTPAPARDFVADPFAHARRAAELLQIGDFACGGIQPPRVELDLGAVPIDPEAHARTVAQALGARREALCEGLLVESMDPSVAPRLAAFAAALRREGVQLPLAVRVEASWAEHCLAVADRVVAMAGALVSDAELANTARVVAAAGLPLEWELRCATADVAGLLDRVLAASDAQGCRALMFSLDGDLPVQALRAAAARLGEAGRSAPLALRFRRHAGESDEAASLRAAVELGAPLCDGLGDLVGVAAEGFAGIDPALDLAYRILQGARRRTTWTEYIACPSCGRTLFDLEQTTERIKARTRHLAGVKIAIMGCIVNGPGEMADADFGYVGSGVGLVDLYVGKRCVQRKVPQAEADARLIELIRSEGRWVEPD